MTQAKKSDPIGQVVDFLASVKLSFFIFIILAVASVAGTIIPQNQPAQLYMEQYGQGSGNLILGLGLDDTYHAAWFIFLMALLAVNLIICSLKRLPTTLKIMGKTPEQELERFPKPSEDNQLKGSLEQLKAKAEQALKSKIGAPMSKKDADGTVLFAQKGAWSRLGVYVVHLSVLVIFTGAIISNLYGLNGTMTIMEGETGRVVHLDEGKDIQLPFGVRLDKFTVTFYEKIQEMPSEYRSDLTFVRDGKDAATTALKVNHPYTFDGMTFYQSSYGQEPKNLKALMTMDGQSHEVDLKFRRWSDLPGGVKAGIMQYRESINMRGAYEGPMAQILFQDATGKQSALTAFKAGVNLSMGQQSNVKFEILSAESGWFTGLQVKKDPGVWWVWIGCGLMVLGFIITFYISHRKVWIRLTPAKGGCRVEIAGSANKNRPAMKRITRGLALQIGADGRGEDK